MFSFSSIFGSTSLALRCSLSSMPFPILYKNMKDTHNPEKSVVPFLDKHDIFSILSYSVCTFIYAKNINSDSLFVIITYAFVSLLYFIHLNMFLYIISMKRYMLLVTLSIVSIAYVFLYVSQIIIVIMCLLLCLINCIRPIKSNRDMLLKVNIEEISLANLLSENVISFFWIIYGTINQLYSFTLCNCIFFMIDITGMISYSYGKGGLKEDNCAIRLLKKIYRIKEEPLVDNLKEKILKNEEI